MNSAEHLARAFALLIAAAIAACGPPPVRRPGGTPIQKSVDAAQPVNKTRASAEKRKACEGTRALADGPSLVGLDREVREAIARIAFEDLVVVSYSPNGCALALRVLDGCRVGARYAYRPKRGRDKRVLEDAGALSSALPLAGERWLERLAEHGGLRVDENRVGRLEAPRRARSKPFELAGDKCAGATHVVIAMDVGGAAIVGGDADDLESASSPFDGATTEGKLIETFGDPKLCAKAERRSDRTPGCDLPLRLDLVPVRNAPPAPAARVAPIVPVSAESASTNEEPEPKDAAKDEGPLARFEVTAAQYADCVARNDCTAPKTGGRCTYGVPEKKDHPINCVTWKQAKAYCEALKMKLPAERDWEHAARGGDNRPFPWGNTWPPPKGAGNFADARAKAARPHWVTIENYDDGFAETAPVGAASKLNSGGVHDLAGNVMEWTADSWTDKVSRVVRGSSFGHHRRQNLEINHRAAYAEDVASEHIGFRCAR